jgi:hypothetical protein
MLPSQLHGRMQNLGVEVRSQTLGLAQHEHSEAGVGGAQRFLSFLFILLKNDACFLPSPSYIAVLYIAKVAPILR